MAYALIAWHAANDNAAEIQQEIAQALTLRSGASVPVDLHGRLLLYPSPDTGISLETVQRRLARVVRKYKQLEVFVIMPNKGNTVAGWTNATADKLARARPIMNQENVDTYPRLLKRGSVSGDSS